jgi:hypothetical protein
MGRKGNVVKVKSRGLYDDQVREREREAVLVYAYLLCSFLVRLSKPAFTSKVSGLAALSCLIYIYNYIQFIPIYFVLTNRV